MLLVLVLITSFLFCLLEAARVKSIHSIAGLQTELAVMNAFAVYNQELWEEYKSLGRNLSSLESDIIKEASAGNKEEKMSFLNFSVNEVCEFQYVLATDGNGGLFIKGVSNYMQEYALYENVQSLYSAYEAIKGLLEKGELDMTKMDEALKLLESYYSNAKESQDKAGELTKVPTETIIEKNPMEEVKKLQKKGILQLVLKDTDSVSEKTLDMDKVVSKRSKKRGTLEVDSTVSWIDTILFQQYLLKYFGSYGNVKENRALSYELEYLIGKKDNDTANLKATVNKILLTRQAANMLYLLNDAEKMAMAHSAALGFLVVGVPPAVVEVLKMGIIAAWAYAESILDLRTLLDGKNIPFIKSSNLWTLDIDNIASIGNSFLMAKESESGISYENYLRLLLFFEEEENMAFRAMDLMEASIQQKDADFYMDNMVIGAAVQIEYVYKHLFLSFQFLPIYQDNRPVILKDKQFFYAL